MQLIPPPPDKVVTTAMTVGEFQRWFRHAKRGDRRCYYRGYLARDRGGNKDTRLPEQEPVEQLANAVMAFVDRGAARVTQKRHGPGAYEYFVMKL